MCNAEDAGDEMHGIEIDIEDRNNRNNRNNRDEKT
jgi:hypothetical protein